MMFTSGTSEMMLTLQVIRKVVKFWPQATGLLNDEYHGVGERLFHGGLLEDRVRQKKVECFPDEEHTIR
jgi:hypothetical protein